MSVIYTYNVNDIITEFKKSEGYDEETMNFFNTFSYSNIINQNQIKMNTVNVFNNTINENATKSTIISYLNKLNARNISRITISLREISIDTIDDLNELVTQCITKIKKDTEQMKPITAKLCYELLATFFTTETGEKIYFRNILLNQIKAEYISSINFENESWSTEQGEKTSVLIGILYNNCIIPENVIFGIISDYKNKIDFIEGVTIDGNRVEQIIRQFMILMSSIVLNVDSLKLFDGLGEYLDGELAKYNDKKLISKKMSLICKNLMCDVEKFKNNSNVTHEKII